nr:hypothetical protein [uncultured Campylobacter sp.]
MHHEIDGFANFDSFAPYGDDIVLVIDADRCVGYAVTVYRHGARAEQFFYGRAGTQAPVRQ